jgi:pimeloyl-ACP methyl ester carboxylesterase
LAILLFIAVVILAIVVAGALYQVLGSAIDRRKFPPPGRVVDAGSARLHLFEAGVGPSVILESGIGATCLNWTDVQAKVSSFARVCSYDRASLGWSDPGGQRSLSPMVEELHSLLAAAQVPGPYVMVGHSFGGLLARVYAARYPDEVSGLVLIDPLGPGDWLAPTDVQKRMLSKAVMLSRRGAFLARFGVVRFSLAMLLAGVRHLPQLIARASSGQGESAISRLVREVQKMPRETWPVVQAHWCLPKSFHGMADHLESLPVSSAEAAEAGDPPPVPIVILSARTATAAQMADREALVERSRHGRHTVTKYGHWIHLDEPELVVEAIREVLSA